MILIIEGVGYIGGHTVKSLIEEAIKKYDKDPKKSLNIRNKISDIKASYNSEIPFRYLIRKKNINIFSITKVFRSLFDCANFLENNPEI